MKKIILLLILLFAFPMLVSAVSEKLVYNNWVYDSQSLNIDNQIFHVWLSKGASTVTVKFDDSYISLKKGECETKEYNKVCYNESDYDWDKREMKVRLRIYSLVPDIKLTRTTDKKTFLVDEEVTFTVKIDNSGGRAAINASYSDSFPSFVEITDTSGCTKIGSGIIWEGRIGKGKTQEIEYTIKSNKEFNLKSRGQFKYYDGSAIETIYSSQIHLIANHFFDIIESHNESVFVGNAMEVKLNLTNNYDKRIEVNQLRLDIPKSVDIRKIYPFSRADENVYTWEGDISENRTKKFSMKFDTRRVGIAVIFLTANITYGDTTAIIEKMIEMPIRNVDMFINTNLEDDELLESDQEKNIKIWIQNPNPEVEFRNINFIVDTNVTFIQSIYFSKLNTTEQKKVIDFTFIAPNVTTITKFPFKIRVSYETEYGDRFFEELEIKNLRVEPVKELSIKHSFSKSRVEERDETRLTVKVKNNRDVDLDIIDIYDNSSILLAKEGVSSAVVSIDKKKEVTVYSYLIKAPYVRNETKFAITTTANYEYDNKNHSDTKTSYITIIPKKIKIDVSKKLVKKDDYYQGQVLELDYTLKNTEDEAVKDIIIYFLKQEEFDVMGREVYTIERLDPKEELKLGGLEKIRPKYNGSLKMGRTIVTYRDEDNNLYNSTSNTISLKVNRSYIQGPSIILKKIVPDQIKEGKKFGVELVAKNIGDSPVDVDITDYGKVWKTRLYKGQTKTYNYDMKVGKTTLLEPAQARYNYFAMPVYAYSNSPKIKVIGEKVEKPKPVVEEEEPGVVEEDEEIVKKAGEKKGFFARLWIVFSSWFVG